MKNLLYLAIAASVVPLADALQLTRRDVPAVIETRIQRKPYADEVLRDRRKKEHRLRRRTGTVSVSLSNDVTLYIANVSLGTPAQTVSLHIDTGSSDLWVNAPNSTLCEEYAAECDETGVYTAADSSTYAYVNSDFNITYEDGSGAVGIYATDNLEIGGVTLDALQFGIGYESTSDEGILGIGYTTNEAQIEFTSTTYPNVPAAMKNKGYINSAAYSLWLNDLDASTGAILFGGVNTAKFTGELETVPIIEEYGVYSAFVIAMTALGTNGDNTSLVSNENMAVLLDSGTSLTYLPESIVDTLFEKYSAQWDSSIGAAIVDCSLADSTDTIDYTFSVPTISVSMRELVLVAGYQDGTEYCIFGIAPTDDDIYILGDTFLRSAYVVYDLSNNEISLAQTNFNATDDDIVEITDSATGVPDSTVVATAVTSVSGSATGLGRVDTQSDVSTNAAPPALITPPPKAYAALAVAGVGALLAL